MQDYYTLQVAGVTRQLPIMQISDSLAIASFVILGDCEIVTKSAPLIEKQLPQVDYIVTAEAKGIPLVHELCRLRGLPYYIVARKSVKPYMSQPLTDEVVSITTQKAQTLCLDGKDALLLKGKKVAVVDDVISTGESLQAIERLVEKAGGEIVAKAAILAEGDAAKRSDIIFLEELPLFPVGGWERARAGCPAFVEPAGRQNGKGDARVNACPGREKACSSFACRAAPCKTMAAAPRFAWRGHVSFLSGTHSAGLCKRLCACRARFFVAFRPFGRFLPRTFFDSQKGCASGFPAGRVSKMETIVCNLFQVK